MTALKLNTSTSAQGAPAAPPNVPSFISQGPAQAGSSSSSSGGTAKAPASSSSAAAQPIPRPVRPVAPAIPPSSSPKQSKTSSATSKSPEPLPNSPPYSPISPPLHPLKRTPIPPPKLPANYASLGGRAPLTHKSHPEAVASAPPPPAPLDPIDFQNNPDVIALQTTMMLLQQQKRRAEEDLIKLRDAKDAAIQRPLDFARDLAGGRVSQGGSRDAANEEDDGSDDAEVKQEDGAGFTAGNGLEPSAMKASSSTKGKTTAPAPAPWTNLPKAQDVVRCPPINWSQYAVEGDALNRLHSDQVTRPTQGTPAVMAANGTFQFTGAANPDDGKMVDGISAPFNPLRDKKPAKGGAPKRGC